MSARILVVDDQVAVREVLGAMLELAGYDVRQASNGREAMDALASAEYDLMLLDVNLPGQSGWSVLEQARSAAPGLPVLMISDERYEDEALQRGAVAFLAKPYRRSALEDAVRDALVVTA
jgi:DNA-binding NtrC family response regulator